LVVVAVKVSACLPLLGAEVNRCENDVRQPSDRSNTWTTLATQLVNTVLQTTTNQVIAQETK